MDTPRTDIQPDNRIFSTPKIQKQTDRKFEYTSGYML
jgi:hypothetical protein